MRAWPVMSAAAGMAIAGCGVAFAFVSLAQADTVETVKATLVDSSVTPARETKSGRLDMPAASNPQSPGDAAPGTWNATLAESSVIC